MMPWNPPLKRLSERNTSRSCRRNRRLDPYCDVCRAPFSCHRVRCIGDAMVHPYLREYSQEPDRIPGIRWHKAPDRPSITRRVDGCAPCLPKAQTSIKGDASMVIGAPRGYSTAYLPRRIPDLLANKPGPTCALDCPNIRDNPTSLILDALTARHQLPSSMGTADTPRAVELGHRSQVEPTPMSNITCRILRGIHMMGNSQLGGFQEGLRTVAYLGNRRRRREGRGSDEILGFTTWTSASSDIPWRMTSELC